MGFLIMCLDCFPMSGVDIRSQQVTEIKWKLGQGYWEPLLARWYGIVLRCGEQKEAGLAWQQQELRSRCRFGTSTNKCFITGCSDFAELAADGGVLSWHLHSLVPSKYFSESILWNSCCWSLCHGCSTFCTFLILWPYPEGYSTCE